MSDAKRNQRKQKANFRQKYGIHREVQKRCKSRIKRT